MSASAEKRFESRSREETLRIAEELAALSPRPAWYYLEGPLGAGKTLFAKGIARHYGIDESDVSSPTFALVNRYGGASRVVYHLDLYRIEHERELEELGLEEMEEEDAVLVVEWAEKLGRHARREAIRVRLEPAGETTRRITIVEPEPGA